MCMGSAPSISPPAAPPAPAPAPQLPDSAVQQAGSDERARAIAAMGPGDTILTGPMGLEQAPSTTAEGLGGQGLGGQSLGAKTLLGS